MIVFSHDSAFRDVAMQTSGGGWTFLEIVKWTPGGGPVLGDGDPLESRASLRPEGALLRPRFLIGLRGGLKHADSSLADLDVFDRMGGANYMATTLVHRRDGAPEPTRDDLLRLAKDLRELEGELVCDNCGKPVWHLANNGSRHCECGALQA